MVYAHKWESIPIRLLIKYLHCFYVRKNKKSGKKLCSGLLSNY